MQTKRDQSDDEFFALALACRGILQEKGLPRIASRQARMHPQSKGDPVLGLLSSRALSPVPRPELAPASGVCQAANLAEVTTLH